MYGLQVFIQLLILFSPLMIWGRLRSVKSLGSNVEDLVWLLIAIQSSALITLWLGLFNQAAFLFTYVAAIFLIGWVRDFRGRSIDALENKTGSFFLAAVLFSLFVFAYRALTDVPKAGDALAYHLPMAAQWVQSQSLLAQDSRVWFYPGGYELLTAVFFLVAQNDLLWFLPDIFALTLLALSTYQTLALLGVNSVAAGLFVGALALTPVVSRTLGVGDNDLWVAALAMTAIGAFLRSVIDESREARALGVICLGALACAKYTAFPFAFLLISYFVFFKGNATRKIGIPEVASLAVAAFLALSFPLRNFLITGNPIYPTGMGNFLPWGDTSHLVSILNKITPDQLKSTALIRHGSDVWEIFLRKILEQAAILPLLALTASALSLVRVKSFKIERNELFVLVAAVLAFMVFIAQPLVVENVPGTKNQISGGWSLRFALPWIVLICTFLFAKIPSKYSVYAAIVLVILSIYWKGDWVQGIFILIFFGAIALIDKRFGIQTKHSVFLWPLLLTAFVMAYQGDRQHQAWQSYTFGGKTDIARVFQRSECSHVIVLSTALRAYPLVGYNFKHRVISVGMSLPAEHFVESAVLNNANVVIATVENGDANSPTFGTFPPETRRILPLLGAGWGLLYEDGFVMAFAKTSLAPECWNSLTMKPTE
jgi:Predicted membrane-bound dolichyl-phosphate-mannose-protein mannosyltransferase